jgi:hypothetical protein
VSAAVAEAAPPQVVPLADTTVAAVAVVITIGDHIISFGTCFGGDVM